MRSLLFAVALSPVLGVAQPTLFDYRVEVGRVYSAGCLDGKAEEEAKAIDRDNELVEKDDSEGDAAGAGPDGASAAPPTTPSASPHDECVNGRSRLYLMWDHVEAPGDTLAPAGTVVTRQATGLVGGAATTLTYADTLVAPMLAAARGTRAPIIPGGRTGDAAVYPDSKRPYILHVNFLLTPSGVPWSDEGGPLTGERLRAVDYYFQLRNRESVTFPYSAGALGAVTVPIKVRVGADGTGSDVSADAGLGLYVGRRWGSVTYTYHEHAAKMLEATRHGTAGFFVGLSAMNLDSTNALRRGVALDDTGAIVPSDGRTLPLSASKSVAVLSFGLGYMRGVRGVEAGVFIGYDLAFTRDAEWEYDLRRHPVPWFGFALGFKLLKLGG